MNTFSKLLRISVRRVTRWAWMPEILASDSLVKITELHAKDGAMELHIKQRPEMAAWVAKCFASLVAQSENYTELKFELVERTNYEWLTVLVKKGKGKTPHELRRLAEAERDALKVTVEKFESQGTPPEADPSHEVYSA